jgi:hypothetical protein
VRTLGKLLRTSTFRFAAVYLLLFALSSGAILAYVYWNTAVLLERQTDEIIEAEITGLNEQYRQRGLDGLIEIVGERSARSRDGLYLFTNYFGRRLAGNMDGKPEEVSGQSGWAEFPYTVRTAEGEEQHRARVFHTQLRGGFTLIVGRDVEERLQFSNLIQQTLFIALVMIAGLGLAGGLLMSRNFLTRIDSIGETSRSIMAGDLTERMPVSGTGDELDRLANSLNAMLDQIERLMNGMKEVTDNVAHDLKTPLTRLRARVEDALRSNSPKQHRDALEQTLHEADDLLKTFTSLLSIARTEAGEARTGLEPTDITELISELGELYEPLAEEAGGTLEVFAANGLRVTGDRQLLAQAVTNLLDNALKYATWAPDAEARPDLVVRLRADRQGNDVVIDVSDNGPGIPEADRERVVERFVRLDESRSKPGSGLGLSLASGVASLHRGRLELADAAPGLRARLYLPAS